MDFTTIFLQQSFFITVVFLLLFMPGWILLRTLFPAKAFEPFERIVVSVPISFALITLSAIALDLYGLRFDRMHLAVLIATILILPFVLYLPLRKYRDIHMNTDLFSFPKKQTRLIIIIILFAIVIKTIFLINTIFPTATDLGHHLYWVEKITVDHELPTYEKREIVMSSDDAYVISDPEPIADFIIGEHVLLAMIKTFTGLPVISTFPSLFLFVINVFTMLMIFVLTRRFFEKHHYGSLIAIGALLLSGPLWAISGAQAKFVSGGVIGNILGNLLIPATLYFLYRAFVHKNALLLSIAIILGVTLAYTHHLSALIFGYVFLCSIIYFIILNKEKLSGYSRLFVLLRDPLIIVLFAAIGALFFFAPPSYLDKDVISASVGAPSKSTRTGIPFTELMYMIGDARFVLGLIGFAFLLIAAVTTRIRHRTMSYLQKINVSIYTLSFLLGWCSAVLLMTLAPHALQVNIISSRIATYCAFPIMILGAYACVHMLHTVLHKKNSRTFVPQIIVSTMALLIITFIFVSGSRDNATALNPAPKTTAALQTFHIGEYASKVLKNTIVSDDAWMVKDHNYIVADTWLKINFAYDYSFPLSRSYFERYENNPDRETCTREMISDPTSDFAITCFDQLNVTSVLVSTEDDAAQFEVLDHFDRIYQNDLLSLFVRKNSEKP
jgi:hypothetical protein